MPIDFPYIDVIDSPFYEIVYVFEAIAVIKTALSESTIDTLIPGFMCQASKNFF